MATTADPITPERFATAIADLPFSNLYAKAAEIRNSISHLKHSNEQMMPFADEGDQDCKEAMFENLTVIGRMNERIAMLKGEVERRGGVWSEHATGEGMLEDGEAIVVNGAPSAPVTNGDVVPQRREPSGRLTDEELRRQLEAQMGGGGDGEEEGEDGVHL